MAENLRKKNDNVQMLRGLCCIFICLNHCLFFNKYSFGEIGVEFFIILSGLLTAANASRSPHLRKNYFLSKIRTILPLYWAVTIVVFALGKVLPQLFSSLEFDYLTLIKSLLLVPGNTFILFPGWTLTYFFVFYLIYRIADFVGEKRDLVASLIIVLLVVLGKVAEIVFADNLFSQYANPILLEFVYGIVLWYLVGHIKTKNYEWLGWILLPVLFFNYNKYLGIRWIVPSILTCIVILCFYNCDCQNRGGISFYKRLEISLLQCIFCIQL
ncbi:MAG: acyltransferase family protein [Blautia sp.]|uniref:acyltransferase family protein n=1 Tax=Blautia sp. TaxID=1955243 RepID=UPI00399258B4